MTLRNPNLDPNWRKLKKNGPAPMSIEEIFEKYVRVTTDCWIWTGVKSISGYGSHGSKKKGQETVAHRKIYTALVGPIPKGLQIDHLCRNRLCVNPQHLEPVTARENLDRAENAPATINRNKTECLRGHPYNEANTIFHIKSGKRECRPCKQIREQNRRVAISV